MPEVRGFACQIELEHTHTIRTRIFSKSVVNYEEKIFSITMRRLGMFLKRLQTSLSK
jgi:hypothetical protein